MLSAVKSVAADVDMEGEDVRDSLGAVVRMAEAGWLRPVCVNAEGEAEEPYLLLKEQRSQQVRSKYGC